MENVFFYNEDTQFLISATKEEKYRVAKAEREIFKQGVAYEIDNHFYIRGVIAFAFKAISKALPFDYKKNIKDFLDLVGEEVLRAKKKHPGEFHNCHEGFAVVKEEVDELWDEVKAQVHDKEKMKKKTIQLAAMAARYYIETC